MTTDDRDILELLRDEKGGYGRSVRPPWQSKSTFQDSRFCINYDYPDRAHPCNECDLLDFVSPEHRTEEVPCHFFPLNTDGDTIEDLELQDNQGKARARSERMASCQDQGDRRDRSCLKNEDVDVRPERCPVSGLLM